MKPASQYSQTKGRNSAWVRRCALSSCTVVKFSAQSPHTGPGTSASSSLISDSSDDAFSRPFLVVFATASPPERSTGTGASASVSVATPLSDSLELLVSLSLAFCCVKAVLRTLLDDIMDDDGDDKDG